MRFTMTLMPAILAVLALTLLAAPSHAKCKPPKMLKKGKCVYPSKRVKVVKCKRGTVRFKRKCYAPTALPRSVKPTVRFTRNKVETVSPFLFEGRKQTLTIPMMIVLNEVIAGLRVMPAIKIQVEGHTDGAFKNGKKASLLSLSRALEVEDYLVAGGIGKGRVTIKGFGMARPRYTNKTPAGRASNNRIEFRVTNQVVAKASGRPAPIPPKRNDLLTVLKKPRKTQKGGDPARLSSAQVRSVLNRKKSKFRSCLKLMATPPAGSVTIRTSITILGDGSVASAKIRSSGGTSGEVTTCVARALKGLKFKRFTDSKMVVNYPVRMQ